METPKASPSFKVYYRDGSTYVGPPENTPILDVVLIQEFDSSHGRRLITGGDFYMWENGAWTPGDEWTMISYMNRPGFKKRFLIGVMVHSEEWNYFLKVAKEDPFFPERTGHYSWEK